MSTVTVITCSSVSTIVYRPPLSALDRITRALSISRTLIDRRAVRIDSFGRLHQRIRATSSSESVIISQLLRKNGDRLALLWRSF